MKFFSSNVDGLLTSDNIVKFYWNIFFNVLYLSWINETLKLYNTYILFFFFFSVLNIFEFILNYIRLSNFERDFNSSS